MRQQGDEGNRVSHPSRRGLYLIAIYFLLTISSRYSRDMDSLESAIVTAIKTGKFSGDVTKLCMNYFVEGSYYSGLWMQLGGSSQGNFLNNMGGKVYLIKDLQIMQGDWMLYKITATFYNGDYIDDGVLSQGFMVNTSDVETVQEPLALLVKLKANHTLNAIEIEQKILKTVRTLHNNITGLTLAFSLAEQDRLVATLQLQSGVENEVTYHIKVASRYERTGRTMIFAACLLLISYTSFTALLKIVGAVFEGTENPNKYSIITMLVVTTWDLVLCIVAFLEAFNDQEYLLLLKILFNIVGEDQSWVVSFKLGSSSINQQNLLLYIVPAFLFCLLFSHLELRLVLLIYQSKTTSTSLHQLFCKFNIISYGSFALTYPVLLFTNMNWVLFVGLSLMLLPQIHQNAIRGHRPDLTSPYYSKVLLVRFILILYIRCFPFNIFQLKPDYTLCLICFTLIGFQVALLWTQKTYGPKKVLPRCLLPQVFNYQCCDQFPLTDTLDIQQCSICLTSIHLDVPPPPSEEDGLGNMQEIITYRLMKTPCKHIYHSSCLMQWMKIKMECPQCRLKLPAFE